MFQIPQINLEQLLNGFDRRESAAEYFNASLPVDGRIVAREEFLLSLLRNPSTGNGKAFNVGKIGKVAEQLGYHDVALRALEIASPAEASQRRKEMFLKSIQGMTPWQYAEQLLAAGYAEEALDFSLEDQRKHNRGEPVLDTAVEFLCDFQNALDKQRRKRGLCSAILKLGGLQDQEEKNQARALLSLLYETLVDTYIDEKSYEKAVETSAAAEKRGLALRLPTAERKRITVEHLFSEAIDRISGKTPSPLEMSPPEPRLLVDMAVHLEKTYGSREEYTHTLQRGIELLEKQWQILREEKVTHSAYCDFADLDATCGELGPQCHCGGEQREQEQCATISTLEQKIDEWKGILNPPAPPIAPPPSSPGPYAEATPALTTPEEKIQEFRLVKNYRQALKLAWEHNQFDLIVDLYLEEGDVYGLLKTKLTEAPAGRQKVVEYLRTIILERLASSSARQADEEHKPDLYQSYYLLRDVDAGALAELRARMKEWCEEHREHYLLGMLHEDEGDLAPAIEAFTLDAARDSSTWLHIAELERKRGNTARYQKIWRKTAELFESRGSYEQALEAAEKAGLPEKVRLYRDILELRRPAPLLSVEREAIRRVLDEVPPQDRRKSLETMLERELPSIFDAVLAHAEQIRHYSPAGNSQWLIDKVYSLLALDSGVIDRYAQVAAVLPDSELGRIFGLGVEEYCKNPAALPEVIRKATSLPVEHQVRVLETILGKVVHPFVGKMLASWYHFSAPPEKLMQIAAQAFELPNSRLDMYAAALSRTEVDGKPDKRFFDLAQENWEHHYDTLCAALCAPPSSLAAPELTERKEIAIDRIGGIRKGIKERVERELDAFISIFREMYCQWKVRAYQEIPAFREQATREILQLARRKHGHVLEEAVVEMLSQFNFHAFFRDSETLGGRLENIRPGSSFESRSLGELLLPCLLEQRHYMKDRKLSDTFINALNRLRMGLSSKFMFDDFRVEWNANRMYDIFNLVAECTSLGGKYQQYGHYHLQDGNMGILAGNIYNNGQYLSTVGKAFLARARDDGQSPLLYVDGVVMLQDIADLLHEPSGEAHWMPLFTKAIIRVAQYHHLPVLVFNAHHNSAQRSVWQYCQHLADLVGLEEGKDYVYREDHRELMTTAELGFQLRRPAALDNLHYVEKSAGDYQGDHLLGGFWINYYDVKRAEKPKPWSAIPDFVQCLEHRERPHLNPGRGHIIGFRRSTVELVKLFNEKYGKGYGVIS